jgi:hypothetical protein
MWEDNIKMYLKEIEWKIVDCIFIDVGTKEGLMYIHANITSSFMKYGKA